MGPYKYGAYINSVGLYLEDNGYYTEHEITLTMGHRTEAHTHTIEYKYFSALNFNID